MAYKFSFLSLFLKSPRAKVKPLASKETYNKWDNVDITHLLKHYEHRLLSLEAEALEFEKGKFTSVKSSYETRSKIVKLKNKLMTMQSDYNLLTSESIPDIGLPLIKDTHPGDQAILEQFLTSQEDSLKFLIKNASLVESWCLKASRGETTLLQFLLRLSKIGGMIRHLNLLMVTAETEEKSLQELLDKAVQNISKSQPNLHFKMNPTKSVFEHLAFWFGRIERQITRVAKLKLELKKQNHKIESMTEWLETSKKDAFFCHQDEILSPLDLAQLDQQSPLLRRIQKFSKVNANISNYLGSLEQNEGKAS